MKRGFTLIELLVVISIVGLLSSVVLAALNTARDKGRIGAGRQFEANVFHAEADQAIGLWDFEDCSLTGAADRSGNGYAGTLTNGAAFLPGNTPTGSGCSVNFDGIDDYVNIPNSNAAAFTSADNFTVTAWINPDSTRSCGVVCPIFDKFAATGYRFLVNTSTLNLQIRNSGGTFWSYNGQTVPDGKWSHVAVVYTVGGAVTFYRDGASLSGGTVATAFDSLTTNAKVGYSSNNATYFKGQVDNVRVFAKALTAANIQEIYARGASAYANLAVR